MSYFSVFLAFTISVIAIVTVGNALDRQHVMTIAREMRYMQPAETLAVANVQSALAAQVQANPGAPIRNISLPTTYQSVCGNGPSQQSAPCPQYLATAVVEGATSAGGSASGSESCSNANDSTETDETCVSVLLSLNLADASENIIGSRSDEITYRTLNAIPYAIVAGVNNLAGGIATGEANANGCDPSTPSTCSASPPPSSLTDTRLHSFDQCVATLTLCTNPSTGQPYQPRESSVWNTQGYANANQTVGSWNK